MKNVRHRRLLLFLCGVALLAALDICLFTGLIGGWSRWYSPFRPYRLQTNALLEGRFAFSDSPAAMEHDLAWGRTGVQQVWGLGVPFIRLPFEAAAQAAGFPAFPDRIVLGLSVATVAFLLLVAFTLKDNSNTINTWFSGVINNPLRIFSVALLLAFPPVVVLGAGPFNVYEEAVFYGYYYAIGLLAGLLLFMRSKTLWGYASLCFLAGIAGFFRPTILAYGVATTAVAFVTMWRTPSRAKTLVGPALFTSAIGLLLWSNAVRFGSPLEFGHRLNVSATDIMYYSRFGAPFDKTPLLPATAELFGSIFLVENLNGFRVYDQGIVAFQSPTPRWRHFYHSTYDLTYLAGFVGGVGALLYLRLPRWRQGPASAATVLLLWSAVGFTLTAMFYLRFAFMSSRYMIDFAPALAVSFASLFLYVESALPRFSRFGVAVACVGVMWWGWQMNSGRNAFGVTPPVSCERMLEATRPRSVVNVELPSQYDAETIDEFSWLQANGFGWRKNGEPTEGLVPLYFSAVERVEVAVATLDGSPLERESCECVRVQADGENLIRVSTEMDDNTATIVFKSHDHRPVDAEKKACLVTIAMCRPESVPSSKSRLALLRVSLLTDVSGLSASR